MKKLAIVSIALAMLVAVPALARPVHHQDQQNRGWTSRQQINPGWTSRQQINPGYYDPSRVKPGNVPFAPF